MGDSFPEQRLGSLHRGVIIGLMIVGYGWFMREPQGSFTQLLLVGAALQLTIIIVRRLVSPDVRPMAQYVFELLADGVTVLMFALGVFGNIARHSQDL